MRRLSEQNHSSAFLGLKLRTTSVRWKRRYKLARLVKLNGGNQLLGHEIEVGNQIVKILA